VTSPPATRRDFRPDIEGLRALAVLSVLVFHLSAAFLPGGFIGVDVFLVISGFLITAHLVREHQTAGRISLARFYARRALRIVPAATATLIATAVAIWQLSPRLDRDDFGGDIVAATVYGVNWRLAERSVDYLAAQVGLSPIQHFWSLSVEEQYYLFWPLLLVVAGAVAGKKIGSRRSQLAMAVAGVLVVAASLGWTLATVREQDASAYFVTTTRLWELGAGALLALVTFRLRRSVAFVVGAVSLPLLLASFVLLDGGQGWPTAWTLVPIGATIGLLAAGRSGFGLPSDRLLALPPLVWVGGLSYSLYLWHWPITVFAKQLTDRRGGAYVAGVLILSFALAWLTKILIEDPIRFSPWLRAKARRGIAVGVVGALASFMAGVAVMSLHVSAMPVEKPEQRDVVGAAIFETPISRTSVADLRESRMPFTPAPDDAEDDRPVAYDMDCQQQNARSSEVKQCTFGDRRAARAWLMVGDSKIMQWLPALDRIAAKQHRRLVVITKGGCAFSASKAVGDDGDAYRECNEWNRKALRRVLKVSPEIVLTSQHERFAYPPDDGGRARLAAGLATRWLELRQSGARVVVIGDNPTPPEDVVECVAEHPRRVGTCAFELDDGTQDTGIRAQRQAIRATGGSQVDADGRVTRGRDRGLALVDLIGAICPPQLSKCPAVIGHVLLYRDETHLSATYVETLEPIIARALRALTAGPTPR
jgi:peptidoglycan/LPS O-acetylase OafA/YrhL